MVGGVLSGKTTRNLLYASVSAVPQLFLNRNHLLYFKLGMTKRDALEVARKLTVEALKSGNTLAINMKDATPTWTKWTTKTEFPIQIFEKGGKVFMNSISVEPIN